MEFRSLSSSWPFQLLVFFVTFVGVIATTPIRWLVPGTFALSRLGELWFEVSPNML
jgi:hypothetical protein